MWKVNHSLAITVLDANILLLRLWVSLIRSSAPRWDLLQHQDILVMFFKSDCIRLNVLQTQIIPHTDAAVHSDNDRNFQSFRNSFGACDVNCRVYKLSHFQSQGLERSEGGPDEVWSIWSENCFFTLVSENLWRGLVWWWEISGEGTEQANWEPEAFVLPRNMWQTAPSFSKVLSCDP